MILQKGSLNVRLYTCGSCRDLFKTKFEVIFMVVFHLKSLKLCEFVFP